MSPKTSKPDPSSEPDVAIDIPHEQVRDEPAPITAPPLPEEMAPQPANVITKASEKTNQPVIPSPTIHEFHENPGRRWPTVIGYMLAALLVAIAVVYLGRWIYHKTTHRSTITPAANSNKVPAVPTGAATPNQSQPSTTANPNLGTNSNSSTSQNQTSPSTAPGQLPNNGPGDVVAIFLGASLIFGGLHYLLSIRRSVN